MQPTCHDMHRMQPACHGMRRMQPALVSMRRMQPALVGMRRMQPTCTVLTHVRTGAAGFLYCVQLSLYTVHVCTVYNTLQNTALLTIVHTIHAYISCMHPKHDLSVYHVYTGCSYCKLSASTTLEQMTVPGLPLQTSLFQHSPSAICFYTLRTVCHSHRASVLLEKQTLHWLRQWVSNHLCRRAVLQDELLFL